MMARRAQDIRSRLLDKMLLHGHVTRRQIGKGFGLSKVAASRHADSMKTHGLAHSRTRRLPKVRRPVEFLHVNDSLATALSVHLSRHEVRADIVGASGKLLCSRELPMACAHQIDILDGIRELVAWAKEQTRESRRKLDLAGFAIAGFLEPTSGMIFGVRDIPDWEPCHLGDVVEGLAEIPCYPWTGVSCRLRGLAKRVGSDHRVGYVAWGEHELAIASLVDGTIRLGRLGTAGGHVHQTVSDSNLRCACGRRGCLYSHLRLGDATTGMILKALSRILSEIDAEILGIEWPHGDPAVAGVCAAAGVRQLYRVEDGLALERQGLNMACARAMLQSALAGRQPEASREIVDHEVFRTPGHCGVESAQETRNGPANESPPITLMQMEV